ncbi:MAG: sigma-70 family RNA polymerase sigma factor [Acidobacteria bacterium]|nr:sigma-70 family RNA polymerase sigma factor [Acidobacteriota bacterium]
MAPSDRDLLRRLAAGDREALGPLMERHYQRIYRIALSYLRDADEALDCTQETFVKAFRHAGRWDGASEAAPWLTRIAVNDAIDRYRKGKRRATSESPLPESDHDERLAGEEPSPERRVLGREVSERIGQALRGLPEQQRAVFVLRHYDEMTLPEIADALGMSLGTVKSSLHRAVHRLRERLAGLRAQA